MIEGSSRRQTQCDSRTGGIAIRETEEVIVRGSVGHSIQEGRKKGKIQATPTMSILLQLHVTSFCDPHPP